MQRSELLDRVREHLSERILHGHENPSPELIAQAFRAQAEGIVGDTEMLVGLRTLQTELTGAGPLDVLLRLPDISDVLVTSCDSVWFDRGQGLERSSIVFPDDDAVRFLAQRLATMGGRRLDDAQPWVDVILTNLGEGRHPVRMHAILAPLSQSGTALALRVLRPATTTLENLRDQGTFNEECADFLKLLVHSRKNFLISGATGSGKTTLLGAMLAEVPHNHRIVCIEDSAELNPPHPHVVRLVTRTSNVEGVGSVSMQELLRQALRMRPDRIVVGEVRGAEVVDLLSALNTGHEGGCGSIHANSPEDVPARVAALGVMAGLGTEAIEIQLASALDVVLGMRRLPCGSRVLESIGALFLANRTSQSPQSQSRIIVDPVWTRDQKATESYKALCRALQGSS